MGNKYLAKVIAKDNQGLKLISACCFKAKIKVSELKYLRKNQIFLVFLKRFLLENEGDKKEINSVCKFEFVENVKSKNINQSDKDLTLELLTINLLKNNEKFDISLVFSNNAYIMLSTEVIEATLEDQSAI